MEYVFQSMQNLLNAALEGHADLAAKSIEDLVANLKELPESIDVNIYHSLEPFHIQFDR